MFTIDLIPFPHDDFLIPLSNSTAIEDINIPDKLYTVFLQNVLGIANNILAGPSNPLDDQLPLPDIPADTFAGPSNPPDDPLSLPNIPADTFAGPSNPPDDPLPLPADTFAGPSNPANDHPVRRVSDGSQTGLRPGGGGGGGGIGYQVADTGPTILHFRLL